MRNSIFSLKRGFYSRNGIFELTTTFLSFIFIFIFLFFHWKQGTFKNTSYQKLSLWSFLSLVWTKHYITLYVWFFRIILFTVGSMKIFVGNICQWIVFMSIITNAVSKNIFEYLFIFNPIKAGKEVNLTLPVAFQNLFFQRRVKALAFCDLLEDTFFLKILLKFLKSFGRDENFLHQY